MCVLCVCVGGGVLVLEGGEVLQGVSQASRWAWRTETGRLLGGRGRVAAASVAGRIAGWRGFKG
jgi:hypothetical protein